MRAPREGALGGHETGGVKIDLQGLDSQHHSVYWRLKVDALKRAVNAVLSDRKYC